MRTTTQPAAAASTDTEERSGSVLVSAFAVVCVLASTFALNPYGFGIGDQAITIPFVKAWMNPGLYPADYLIAEKSHLYTLVWPALGLFARHVPIRLETLFFVTYLSALYATFVTFAGFARVVTGSAAAALIAMFFLLFERTLLGGANTLDASLLTRIVALPLVFLSLAWIVRERWIWAFASLGFAFLIHPLNAVYAGTIAGVVMLARLGLRQPRTVLLSVAAFLVTAGPVIAWRLVASPGSLHAIVPPPGWLDILLVRSPHHAAPLAWGADEYVEAAMVVVALVAMMGARRWTEADRTMAIALMTLVSLWVVAVVFGGLLPVTTVVQLQLARSTVIALYIALAYYGGYLLDAARQDRRPASLAVVVLVGLALLLRAEGWPYALVSAGLLVLALAAHATLRRTAIRTWQVGTIVSLLAIGLALGAWSKNEGVNEEVAGQAAWFDVQHWARENTDVDAAFIIPPSRSGFRVHSERTIYGDWKDGTQAFFNDQFGRVWLRRMQKLGYRDDLGLGGLGGLDRLDPGYRKLSPAQVRLIAAELRPAGGPVFLVTFADQDEDQFERVYRNRRFAVYRIEAFG